MFEPSFLGLNTPWLESQVLVAVASVDQPVLGLEIFALGEADQATFQEPLDQYHKACHAGDAQKISDARRQLGHSILNLSAKQWRTTMENLYKLSWPLQGGMMATPPKSALAEEGAIDFAEGIKRVTIARGKDGMELIKAGKIEEGLSKLEQMVTALTKLSSFSDFAELARFLESVGDHLKESVDQEGEDIETILHINEQVVDTWYKIYGIALEIYETVSKIYLAVAASGDQMRITFKIDQLELGAQVLSNMIEETPPSVIAHTLLEAALTETHRQIVFFTGSGVSQESGVPTFQDHFAWEGRTIQEWDDPDLLRRDPQAVLGFFAHARSIIGALHPNPAHHAIAELEKRFPDQVAVVTQNVDGLHQRAGSKNVFEVHGNLMRSRCINCRAHGIGSSCGQCGGHLRPDVTLMGEQLNTSVLDQAREAIKKARILIIVGTSATVWPVAGLIEEAKEHGVTIIQVDLKKNTDMEPDFFIEGKAGDILPKILDIKGPG